MGKKKIFYLDPDERQWTTEDLGLNWDPFADPRTEKKEIEGIFLMKNGKILELNELSNHCNVCLDPLAYNDEHDSIYCPTCDEWREASCSDPDCEYCLARPTKPSHCK